MFKCCLVLVFFSKVHLNLCEANSKENEQWLNCR